jgi:hypothetical protein
MPPDSASNTKISLKAESESVPASPRGSIEISYGQEGLESWVTIKLPVPAFESEDEARRRAEVLARVRKLVDLACEQSGDGRAAKFVWLPGPIEPASKEALDASSVEGTRWTITMEDRQQK